ncbi:MAG: dTMP kinase [Planctomycetota bacterium]
MFVSLDGVDGGGKSTQLKLLGEWLRAAGHEVVMCRDPGSTALGDQLREVLLHRLDLSIDRCSEMLIYMAARAQLVAEVIRPALAAGKFVLCDRFVLANIVYQAHAGGLDVAQVRAVGDIAVGDVRPDLVLVLDVLPEIAAQRMARTRDRMEQQGDDFFRRVRAGFLAEAERDPQHLRVIDAGRSVDEVQAELRAAIVAKQSELLAQRR